MSLCVIVIIIIMCNTQTLNAKVLHVLALSFIVNKFMSVYMQNCWKSWKKKKKRIILYIVKPCGLWEVRWHTFSVHLQYDSMRANLPLYLTIQFTFFPFFLSSFSVLFLSIFLLFFFFLLLHNIHTFIVFHSFIPWTVINLNHRKCSATKRMFSFIYLYI